MVDSSRETLAAARPAVDMDGFLAPDSEALRLFQAIDLERMPRHVAVIMDGNGRWARSRDLPRVKGHEAGIDSVREVVETAARLRFDVLTLYAFSVENWKRPKAEVGTLMMLLKRYLRSELSTLLRNNIRFAAIGRTAELPASVRAALHTAARLTSANRGMLFQVALNYGGRTEIVDACQRLVTEVRAGAAIEINEDTFSRYLYTGTQPDPDLLIRTSGELRVSNFLLWQIAYAELWVTDVLWPDFRREHLFRAVLDYQRRERRYGAVAPSR